MSNPWTIETAASALRAGETTSVALVEQAQTAADQLDPQMGTWIDRYNEQALARADEADAELAAGNDRGPLHGIPLGIKDIISTDEGPTTAQSLTLPASWGEAGDGPLMTRLRDAGAVVMGKTTTMEYAIGRPDFSKPFPVPRNPWNLERWTGGSSSGTGNGVASGQILGGLGTDTGGSVRLPAAYNGISGHKPTFGLVPKSGCVPLGMSYDHIGPMARSAWDCAAMLTVMAGADPSDRTTVDRAPVDYVSSLDRTLDGLKIGVISNERMVSGSSEPTMAVFDEAVGVLTEAGATAHPFEVPLYDEICAGAFLALEAEAFAWHRKLLAERWDDYGRPTRLTIVQGALISASDLVQIERVRQIARRQIVEKMDAEGIDVLVSPTTGYAATPFSGADPKAISNRALHTSAWNSTGAPAFSVPMGLDPDSLPLGLQIVGRPFADDLVLAIGHAYQQRTDWHLRKAPLHG
ncbi:MAG: aspartyl-tRNA(Asn)/glutamyl-tRNA(Gln) amidotransferase subunit A [Acidimicrobiales bacterium]|jgi:aspartyl-tRNA(Asn)/glutamyl-tRNA(Gln) amidotransferase subunit A